MVQLSQTLAPRFGAIHGKATTEKPFSDYRVKYEITLDTPEDAADFRSVLKALPGIRGAEAKLDEALQEGPFKFELTAGTNDSKQPFLSAERRGCGGGFSLTDEILPVFNQLVDRLGLESKFANFLKVWANNDFRGRHTDKHISHPEATLVATEMELQAAKDSQASTASHVCTLLNQLDKARSEESGLRSKIGTLESKLKTVQKEVDDLNNPTWY